MDLNEVKLFLESAVESEVSRQLATSEYSVAPVQAHTHNGTDSLQFAFGNLSDATSYRVVVQKTLTSAQILLLNTTPVTLVPALGTRSVIIVEGITARLVYYGTAYTGANNLEFRYTGAAGAKVTTDMTNTFINSSASSYNYAPAVGTELTPVANSPIVVTVPTANPATGNSTITFCITYRVVSFNA